MYLNYSIPYALRSSFSSPFPLLKRSFDDCSNRENWVTYCSSVARYCYSKIFYCEQYVYLSSPMCLILILINFYFFSHAWAQITARSALGYSSNCDKCHYHHSRRGSGRTPPCRHYGTFLALHSSLLYSSSLHSPFSILSLPSRALARLYSGQIWVRREEGGEKEGERVSHCYYTLLFLNKYYLI
jgi:hypothetical protein